MPDTAKQPVDVGRRIASWRAQRGLSQGVVSRRAGIDPSYLSRIETGKVHPTVRMAMRISDALRVPLDQILGPSPPEQKHRPCPVSANGSCLLDQVEAGVRTEGAAGRGRYTPRQLRLLKSFAVLIEQSEPATLRAVEVLVGELLSSRQPVGTA